jgi:hypothetical protein
MFGGGEGVNCKLRIDYYYNWPYYRTYRCIRHKDCCILLLEGLVYCAYKPDNAYHSGLDTGCHLFHKLG